MQIDQNTLCLFRKMQETDAACFSILTAPVLLPPEKAGSAGTGPRDTGFQKEWYGASPLAGSGSALAGEGQDFRQKRGRSNLGHTDAQFLSSFRTAFHPGQGGLGILFALLNSHGFLKAPILPKSKETIRFSYGNA